MNINECKAISGQNYHGNLNKVHEASTWKVDQSCNELNNNDYDRNGIKIYDLDLIFSHSTQEVYNVYRYLD